jgi:hypothetical protein
MAPADLAGHRAALAITQAATTSAWPAFVPLQKQDKHTTYSLPNSYINCYFFHKKTIDPISIF